MQHVEQLPHPHREVRDYAPFLLILALVIVVAVIAGIYYADRVAPEVSTAASWDNTALLETNPEMKVVLRYATAHTARADEEFLARNPEIKVQRQYEELTTR